MVSFDNKNDSNSSPHHTASGFRNLEPVPDHGFKEFLRWQRERRGNIPEYDSALTTFPVITPDWSAVENPTEGITVTWVGHSTLLVQFEGMNILTDPIFSERSSPVQFAGPKRYTPVPFTINELPRIDAIIISHDHYDHLDEVTVEKLGNNPTWFVPLGLKKWFQDRQITNVVELDWWDEWKTGAFTFVCTPAQHFSGRSPFNRNKTLWCSWAVVGKQYRFWFGGDTGYGRMFKKIGNQYGPFDLSAIPIGAYAPHWFMLPIHVNPPQALLIHQDVRAKQSIAIHWGTFILADDPINEPVQWLKRVRTEKRIDKDTFVILKHGETKVFSAHEH